MRQQKGFTLLELMIVLVIVALLAAFAYPAYQDYVRQARRADGIEMLNRIMQAQERYFTNKRVYEKDLTLLGFGNAVKREGDWYLKTEKGWYEVGARPCNDGDLAEACKTSESSFNECVALIAYAKKGQVEDLALNSRGQRCGW